MAHTTEVQRSHGSVRRFGWKGLLGSRNKEHSSGGRLPLSSFSSSSPLSLPLLPHPPPVFFSNRVLPYSPGWPQTHGPLTPSFPRLELEASLPDRLPVIPYEISPSSSPTGMEAVLVQGMFRALYCHPRSFKLHPSQTRLLTICLFRTAAAAACKGWPQCLPRRGPTSPHRGSISTSDLLIEWEHFFPEQF